VVLATAFLTINLMFSSSGVLSTFSGTAGSMESSRPENCRDPHEHLGASGVCFCNDGYTRDATTLACVAR
jgi:hypothetical protein